MPTADEVEGWYRTLVEQSRDIIAVIDSSGVIQFKSPAIEPRLGYDPDEIIGENALDYVHPDDRPHVEAAITPVIEGEQVRSHPYEYRFRHANGSWLWFESILTDCTESVLDGYVVNSRDITDRVAVERELEQQNERLEKFATVVSHDLRNPLNVADGELELVRAEYDSDRLDEVAAALDRMDTLIEELLTLAREGQSVDDREVVDVAAIAETCWQSVETGEATLVTDIDKTIHADMSRVQQLLENLIRNAVEHTSGEVTVTIGRLEDRTGFYVADDGSGISEDEREQVFETGYTTAESGFGFGLAIVEEIVTAHGWEIQVTDSEDGGVRFEITGVTFNQR